MSPRRTFPTQLLVTVAAMALGLVIPARMTRGNGTYCSLTNAPCSNYTVGCGKWLGLAWQDDESRCDLSCSDGTDCICYITNCSAPPTCNTHSDYYIDQCSGWWFCPCGGP